MAEYLVFPNLALHKSISSLKLPCKREHTLENRIWSKNYKRYQNGSGLNVGYLWTNSNWHWQYPFHSSSLHYLRISCLFRFWPPSNIGEYFLFPGSLYCKPSHEANGVNRPSVIWTLFMLSTIGLSGLGSTFYCQS